MQQTRFKLLELVVLLGFTGQLLFGQQNQQARAVIGVRTPPVRFAVIGDYGTSGPNEQLVADLVKELQPDFVVTTGDNNYPDGAAATIDINVGQYYHEFIDPYLGTYGSGARHNRFFPCLGNHDWVAPGATPYLDYFTLPGNERYYELAKGPVHLFILDSDSAEPDGTTSGSVQALWLQSALAASSAPFKLVVLHHAPHSSSSEHGSNLDLQWPYSAWGADAVLCGHDHVYERLERDGLAYLVDGLGGTSLYPFGEPIAGSEVRFNDDYGALWVEADEQLASLQFVTASGIVTDSLTLTPTLAQLSETPLVSRGAPWRYLDDGSDQGSAWRNPSFADQSWPSGPAQLGYGDGDEATVVSYGSDPQNKYVTTYFRHSFTVADPAAFREVRLRVLRDDGAVVYLNGVEVMRSNMPGGTVSYQTLASSTVNEPEESTSYQVTLPPTALTAGVNVLAVEIHQASPTSSDISIDLDLTGISGGVTLCERGAVWSYRDDGADLGDAWREPDYDATTWAAGPAQLGYGDGDEQTVVSYGPDPNDKYITTYFRKSFDVSDAASFRGLILRLLRDDGIVVYLNGEEAYRGNLPRGHVTAPTLAGYPIQGREESAFFATRIDPRLLVDGVNVLAVELHQVSPQSTDLSMDLELIGL